MMKNSSRQIFITERDYFEHISMGGGVVKGDGDTVNTYGYSDGIAKINVDNENRGWFLFRQDGLKVGDIIEVECEVRVVNGNYPVMVICKGTFNNAGLLDTVPLIQDEWGVVRHKHIVEEDNNYYIGVGYPSADVGHAEFRNFSIVSKTNAKVEWKTQYLVGNWTTVSDVYDYPLEYRRVGNQVTIRGTLTQTTDVDSKLIATLPAPVRPKKIVYGLAYQKGGLDRTLGLRVGINGKLEVTDGSIELGKVISFYFTYDID